MEEFLIIVWKIPAEYSQEFKKIGGIPGEISGRILGGTQEKILEELPGKSLEKYLEKKS